MWARWVAPSSIIVRQCVVWWAEISSCYEDGRVSRVAIILSSVSTLYLEASAAAQPIVEKCRTQCRVVYSVPLAVQISIATSPTYTHKKREKSAIVINSSVINL